MQKLTLCVTSSVQNPCPSGRFVHPPWRGEKTSWERYFHIYGFIQISWIFGDFSTQKYRKIHDISFKWRVFWPILVQIWIFQPNLDFFAGFFENSSGNTAISCVEIRRNKMRFRRFAATIPNYFVQNESDHESDFSFQFLLPISANMQYFWWS